MSFLYSMMMMIGIIGMIEENHSGVVIIDDLTYLVFSSLLSSCVYSYRFAWLVFSVIRQSINQSIDIRYYMKMNKTYIWNVWMVTRIHWMNEWMNIRWAFWLDQRRIDSSISMLSCLPIIIIQKFFPFFCHSMMMIMMMTLMICYYPFGYYHNHHQFNSIRSDLDHHHYKHQYFRCWMPLMVDDDDLGDVLKWLCFRCCINGKKVNQVIIWMVWLLSGEWWWSGWCNNNNDSFNTPIHVLKTDFCSFAPNDYSRNVY